MDISVVEASAHELLSVHVKRTYQELSSSRIIRIKETVMLMGQQRRGERRTMRNEVVGSLESVVHQRSSKCMKKGVDKCSRSGLSVWMIS